MGSYQKRIPAGRHANRSRELHSPAPASPSPHEPSFLLFPTQAQPTYCILVQVAHMRVKSPMAPDRLSSSHDHLAQVQGQMGADIVPNVDVSAVNGARRDAIASCPSAGVAEALLPLASMRTDAHQGSQRATGNFSKTRFVSLRLPVLAHFNSICFILLQIFILSCVTTPPRKRGSAQLILRYWPDMRLTATLRDRTTRSGDKSGQRHRQYCGPRSNRGQYKTRSGIPHDHCPAGWFETR